MKQKGQYKFWLSVVAISIALSATIILVAEQKFHSYMEESKND